MAQVTLPYNLTAGSPENVNNLMSDLNALKDGVNSVDTSQLAAAVGNFGGWTTYTPALTSTGTTPNLGTNGTTRGVYAQIGKIVHANINVKFGSTSASVGTGNYRISLPVTGVSGNNGYIIGHGHIYDANITGLWEVNALQVSTTTFRMIYVNSNNSYGEASATGPQTTAPDTNDYYNLNIFYEAA